MNYAIYGVNRILKDFVYIFENLEIVLLFDDNYEGDVFLSYPVLTFNEAISKKQRYDKIIICDFEKAEKIEKLKAAGLVYEVDYIFEEDFFSRLDEWSIPADRKLAVWGTGNASNEFCLYKDEKPIYCYIDNNKDINTFKDIAVKHPNEITDWKEYFIIIAVVKNQAIKEQLEGYGLKENEDFIYHYSYIGRPSEMLRKTIFDRNFYDLHCETMLNHLEIFQEGNTRCCCTTFVSQNLDNIFSKTQYDLWHSNLHKIMCLSTENKTFSFCNKQMCPLFVDKQGQEIDLSGNEGKYKQMSKKPEVLAIGYDPSCNLRCSTCRKELHYAKGEELKQINRITKKIDDDYLQDCNFLILAGDGEVFASNEYKSIYESAKCKPDYIRLLSNGTLFTRERWESFIHNKRCRVMLTVSIDAATKETYEHIRCNGNFEQLKKNMQFASELKERGALKYFRMNFVVQRENYNEMIPFVQWGESLGVDEIFFTKILNWGTYTDQEFENISMFESDGITPKAALLEVLENPIMKNSKIVDLGTIRYGHKIDKIDKVQNYYMWELEKRGGKLFDEGISNVSATIP